MEVTFPRAAAALVSHAVCAVAGLFHGTPKVVNSLFDDIQRVAEFGSANCPLESETSH